MSDSYWKKVATDPSAGTETYEHELPDGSMLVMVRCVMTMFSGVSVSIAVEHVPASALRTN